MTSNAKKYDPDLDEVWVALIKEATSLGISTEEIRAVFVLALGTLSIKSKRGANDLEGGIGLFFSSHFSKYMMHSLSLSLINCLFKMCISRS